MKYLPELFENNRAWAARRTASDPRFFDRLCEVQNPDFLWIGCADSRVPATEIVGLDPGEMFVHRNVANIVHPDDPNCMAAVQYAIESLNVSHLIVTGHYGCGGVRAALDGGATGAVRHWLAPLEQLAVDHAYELYEIDDHWGRWARLCELNVIAQVHRLLESPVVKAASVRGFEFAIHGWIYDLRDGLLRDLDVSTRVPRSESGALTGA